MSQKVEQTQEQIKSPASEQVNHDEAEAHLQEEKVEVEPIQIKPEQPEAEQLIEDNLPLAESHKSQGNEYFKNQDYQKAISSYQQALRYAPLAEARLRAILYSNIAISLTKEEDHKDAIEYCKKAIKSDSTYLKAHLNLAMGYEKTDNPEEALTAYKKIVEMTPNDVKSMLKVKQLQQTVAELNEKRKKEVMDGLKTIGNSFLGLFGLSLNNFKLNQADNGGYNVSFQN